MAAAAVRHKDAFLPGWNIGTSFHWARIFFADSKTVLFYAYPVRDIVKTIGSRRCLGDVAPLSCLNLPANAGGP
jgi:hypothetical protein